MFDALRTPRGVALFPALRDSFPAGQTVLLCGSRRSIVFSVDASKQPSFIAVQQEGNFPAHLAGGLPESVYDLTQLRLIDVKHFRQSVLANAAGPESQFQIWIHTKFSLPIVKCYFEDSFANG